MVSSTFSDMLKSPYHPDHIFGDEDTWYDAPADLPHQEIEEYFDALKNQNLRIGLALSFLTEKKTNRFVNNPERNYWPVLPTATLRNDIDTFVTEENLGNDDPEYIQLQAICAKLSNLHETHERDIEVEDHTINMTLQKLWAVGETLYEPDNIYTGSDYKRKRDLVLERINECSRTKERLENEYIDTVSKLSKEARAISQEWKRERRESEDELAEQQMRANNSDTQRRLQDALREKAILEGTLIVFQADNELLQTHLDRFQEGYNHLRRLRDGVLGERNQTINRAIEERNNERLRVRNLQAHIGVHREVIILERSRRDIARENCSGLLRSLDMARGELTSVRRDLLEARNRADDLNQGVDLLKMRLSDQINWSDELEMNAMQGEVFNRMTRTWEPSVYKRRLEEYEDREMEERTAKRARNY
ncbi:uncharacterized protein Bfra_011511 [Botrytis fragariae]|uniref:Uncharacterized protein n=1 Tax=Botrytis fragariae TaxID=1964551 RepID=A0A8H6EKN3_9HELO|nr:uncharacterized protein Bfra_011511 [Botrytis fragariae]KAF5875748.1 hypothetical protein Bfra_011511 [Botrytis fragariae]